MNKSGLILLAAGASSRLGTPKQLLLYKNKFLLEYCFEAISGLKDMPIVVVYGANAGMITPKVSRTDFHCIYNSKWEEGIASSIRLGLATLMYIDSSIDNALFMMCDQPFVSSTLLNYMMDKSNETGKEIVACKYGHSVGTPALMGKNFFPDLLSLRGDNGVKKIIMNNPRDVHAVDFPLGRIDVDTADDHISLQELRA